MHLIAQINDLWDMASGAPTLSLQGIGLAGVGWVLKELRDQRAILRASRRESSHVRKVLAAKLGVPESDLIPPPDIDI
jgi:hypothetical protein